jgi:pyruvate, water dikinase
MHEMLHILQDAYGSPVDVEFTANFHDDGYQINLVQCRPLQTAMHGDVARPPRNIRHKNKLFDIRGAIIGANQIIRIDQIIYVVPETYGSLKEQERYEFARLIGRLMHLKTTSSRTIMLMGPGRWGTSIPALGIPVTFTDINTVSVLCEMVEMNENMIPDVSLGTHFFNDIVEANIIYLAIFPQIQENFLNREFFEHEPNMLGKLAPAEKRFEHLVRIIDSSGFPLKRRIIVNANTLEQRAFCYIVGG